MEKQAGSPGTKSSDLHVVSWIENWGLAGVNIRLKVCRGSRDDHEVLYDKSCMVHFDDEIFYRLAFSQLCQQAVKTWT